MKLLEKKNKWIKNDDTMEIKWNHFAFSGRLPTAKIEIDFHFFCARFLLQSGNFPFRVSSNKKEKIMNKMDWEQKKKPEHNESLRSPVYKFSIIFIANNGFQLGRNYIVESTLDWRTYRPSSFALQPSRGFVDSFWAVATIRSDSAFNKKKNGIVSHLGRNFFRIYVTTWMGHLPHSQIASLGFCLPPTTTLNHFVLYYNCVRG